MIFREVTLLMLFCIFKLSAYSQVGLGKDSKLIVTLHNAPFKSLGLRDYRTNHNLIIKGKFKSNFKWEFTVPDSVVENSEYMMLIVPDKDTLANAYHQIGFIHDVNDKKDFFPNIGIQGENNYIEADYQPQRQVILKNENIASFVGVTDSGILGTLILNNFKLSVKNDSSDIAIRSLDPNYSWFSSDGVAKGFSYGDYLHSYVELAKKYPDSRYLMTYLSLNLPHYKNRQDVKLIYNTLSEKFKKTKWAKQIELFFSDKIQDFSFVNLDSNRPETIFKDSSKYKLVTFSASWCIPCIKEIPLLKKLHEALKTKINFVTVSLDYEKDVKKFQNIMVQNKVDWKILYTYKEMDRWRNIAPEKIIPYSMLIHPDGHWEVIDIQKEAVQKKLFELR